MVGETYPTKFLLLQIMISIIRFALCMIHIRTVRVLKLSHYHEHQASLQYRAVFESRITSYASNRVKINLKILDVEVRMLFKAKNYCQRTLELIVIFNP